MHLRRTSFHNYDFGNKRQYRRDIGAFADRNLDLISRNQRAVLFLDTSKAYETEFWLSRGYSKSNLHPCNFNPAEAAIISAKHPGVNAHGVSALRAAQRLKDRQIEPTIIHLDYCGPMSIARFDEINAVVNLIAITGTVICINTLRGREHHIQKYGRLWARAMRHELDLTLEMQDQGKIVVWPDMKNPDDIRRQLHCFAIAARSDVPGKVWGAFDWASKQYRSDAGNQTMFWTATSILKEWPPKRIYSTKVRQLEKFTIENFKCPTN